jgi:cytochrome c oxidase cbb3-type subunit 3
MKSKNNKKQSFLVAILLGLIPFQFVSAQAADAEPDFGFWRWLIIIVAVILAYFIYKLSSMAKSSFVAKARRNIRKSAGESKIVAVLLFVAFQFLSAKLFAQETETAVETSEPSFLSLIPGDIWFGILVILIELVLIFYLLPIEKKLFNENEKEAELEAIEKGEIYVPKKIWWKRVINAFGADNTAEDIEKLDLHHDYDGISELDNSIPAWWNWAFAGTIAFAVIYLIRFFITGGIPDQVKELAEAERIAAIQMEEYLARAGGLIDESNVTMQDETGISKGVVLFDKNCVACHGAQGEGGIGPNLTDEFWLHGGSLKDVFYSIKYGWPEKGMKSWKDDFSPEQIAQIASYVISIQGTNPPNAKEPQGEKYVGNEEE